MPKTIDYPRTTYQSAWEVSEVVDDTGGKCSLETCARKLNRKVSGSFKAILGSAVKFGLLTSKRELLTTTNLFRRIKHAYDKQEEMLYHREAFLHPPLFTQICRKFRNRELPVHMFDIMLIREFGVEEINAQNVSKAFVEGARMTGILDERNVIVDIDQLAAQQGPRRELATGEMPLNLFRGGNSGGKASTNATVSTDSPDTPSVAHPSSPVLDSQQDDTDEDGNTPEGGFVLSQRAGRVTDSVSTDADPISALFGLHQSGTSTTTRQAVPSPTPEAYNNSASNTPARFSEQSPIPTPPVSYTPPNPEPPTPLAPVPPTSGGAPSSFMIHISGPGMDTQLHIQDTDDLEIVRILLDKIRRQLS